MKFSLRDLFWLVLVCALCLWVGLTLQQNHLLQDGAAQLRAENDSLRSEQEKLAKQFQQLQSALYKRGWRTEQTDQGYEVWHTLDLPDFPHLDRELRRPLTP